VKLDAAGVMSEAAPPSTAVPFGCSISEKSGLKRVMRFTKTVLLRAFGMLE
jgi:hypothetical protein